MTLLSCSAVSCMYNKDKLCSKGDILVDGPQAHIPDETCCSSFRHQKNDDYSNSCGCGCETIAVGCKAHECIYNHDQKCTASAIDIAGSHASTQQETMCSTFMQREAYQAGL
ncbi:MAG: DUF1540 domain-containing protein [Eubacteriales bacterium]|nr:DUF1540 domain-containing protein [Eubacteriales bacterium]